MNSSINSLLTWWDNLLHDLALFKQPITRCLILEGQVSVDSDKAWIAIKESLSVTNGACLVLWRKPLIKLLMCLWVLELNIRLNFSWLITWLEVVSSTYMISLIWSNAFKVTLEKYVAVINKEDIRDNMTRRFDFYILDGVIPFIGGQIGR